MTLSEQLDEYSKQLGFNSRQLAEASGLSPSTVSSYRSGAVVPKLGSKRLDQLAQGISALASQAGEDLTPSQVLEALTRSVSDGMTVSYETYVANLTALLRTLGVSNAELARGINYDPSRLSRFLSGKSVPADLGSFTSQVASFIANRFTDQDYLSALERLFGCPGEELNTPKKLSRRVIQWLGSDTSRAAGNPIDGFLSKLDEFDLEDFIRVIKFDSIKLPTVPFTMPTTSYYHGIEEFKQSEFDFMKAVVLSRSMKDLILYSNMPIAEMAKDEEFAKKYMFGMAMLLKKGLHINFIHDVHRPFSEMMLGLEANIPMYMTGQISPWYFQDPSEGVFCHLLKVSGTVAMSGDAIAQDHAHGEYIVTKKKDRVAYYRTRAQAMLRQARPLMEIYRSDRREEFLTALRRLWQKGDRRMIFPSLPLFTMPEELLTSILDRTGVPEDKRREILTFHREYRTAMEALLDRDRITVEIADLSEEKFAEHTPALGLSQLFYEEELRYTYEEYTRHLRETYAFAASHERCTVKAESEPTFRNISFSIIEGKSVVVSKSKSPAIHFIIHHPKMIRAFESFVPPIRE